MATTFGDLTVDYLTPAARPTRRKAHRAHADASTGCSPCLLREPGRVLPHAQILRQVWGPRYASEMNYLRVYMKRLRLRKI